MRNWPTDNSEALAAFMARKTEIDTMLDRLKASVTSISTPTQTPSTGGMSATSSIMPGS